MDSNAMDILVQSMAGFAAPQGGIPSINHESESSIVQAMLAAWKPEASNE